MSTSKHAVTAAIVCAAGLGAALAPADEPASVKLSVPCNLDKAHAAQFYRRIHAAAEEVCAPLDGKDLSFRRLYRSCVSEAVTNAVAQVNSHELTEIHLAETGGNPRL
jgi:UrcA family protein